MGLLTTTYPNDHENRLAYCDHTPLQVSSIRTATGYRVYCLNCTMGGPTSGKRSLNEPLTVYSRTSHGPPLR